MTGSPDESNGPPPSCGKEPRNGTSARKGIGKSEASACALYILFFAGAFAASIAIHPDPSGLGSHTQIGLPPCGFHAATGIPCFSCGMTTAFAHMARGRIDLGFKAQPFGALLFIAGAASWLACAFALASGWSFLDWLSRLRWKYWGPLIALAAVAAWIYKIIVVI